LSRVPTFRESEGEGSEQQREKRLRGGVLAIPGAVPFFFIKSERIFEAGGREKTEKREPFCVLSDRRA